MLTCSNLPTKPEAILLLFNNRESLGRAKVLVSKLGAILFYSGTILNLQNYVKNREDLNRHIPQKIKEFASLALAGRYP